MYLERKNIIYDKNEMIIDKIEGKSSEYEEVAYWRKCYYLHEWFGNNLENGVENCVYSIVSKDDLKLLLSIIEIVLNNHDLAEEYLENDGSYDDYYFKELEESKLKIKSILKGTDFETQEIYYYAWW
jgi:hypothetical protein